MRHRSARFLGVLAWTLVICACAKKDEAEPAPTPDPGPQGAPSSVVTWNPNGWGTTTSMTNWACLGGGTMTIYCRSSTVQHLQITIPGYAGPGAYNIGSGFDPGEAYASFRLNDAYMSPTYSSYDSAGTVTIMSYSSAIGLTGTFDLTLNQTQSIDIDLTNGVLDHVRPQCPTEDTAFTYVIAPFSSQAVTRLDDYDQYMTIERDDQSIHLETYDRMNVADPTTQRNSLYMSIPRDLEAGDHGDPVGLANFSFSYVRPTGSHSATSNAGNALIITEHNVLARRMKGSYNLALSGGQTASGVFDLRY